MSRIRTLIGGLVLLFAVVWGTGMPASLETAEAQESRPIVPGRLPIFQVSVLVDGRPLMGRFERGATYVHAPYGEEYEICVRNTSRDRVAVALFVDGLNTIDATRTSAWDASKWLIEPNDTITIKGWQMSSEHARRFYFTNERDSYAAKLGQKSNLGVISAVFYRERHRVVPITPPKPIPYPTHRDKTQSAQDRDMRSSAESPSAGAAKSSRAREEAATGIGRSIHHDVRYVDVDLDSRPAAQVTIRYEYRTTFAPDPDCRVPCRRDN